MTGELWRKLLMTLNEDIILKNIKALLFSHIASCHENLEILKHIKLIFMPPNTTAVLQTLDQAIIQCLKVEYRRKQLSAIERDKNMKQILKRWHY